MPNVIINTSPMQYLYQTELLEILKTLYGQIIVPQAVREELEVGISLGVPLPNPITYSWITIRIAQSQTILPLVPQLGAGEREAIALATEFQESLVILDDGLARRYARLLNIDFTGTLGVILKAKQEGYLAKVMPILDRLDALNFRISPATRLTIQKLAGEL